ncbi:hypothetical protein AB4Y89_21750 [Terriglobus sp. 2YAB30_2]|uniref:hypothetical protein n=1 Tax=unclassified Terriglobus TaxID=2628988 RepID=UPI003F9EBA84
MFVLIQAILFLPHQAFASAAIQPQRPVISSPKPSSEDSWTISHALHAYGLPEVKAKQKGTLVLDSQNITFTGKVVYRIPRASVIAISDGSERVEMWGIKGRLLRMAIPNGGGLAAAGFMHHKESSLTVEFRDSRGGYHAAVFVVPPADATLAMATFAPRTDDAASATEPVDITAPVANVCDGASVKPGSVLVAAPAWEQVEVPASYRALVYEHLVDRMRRVQGVSQIYREGEPGAQRGCPQSMVRIAIAGFRPGNQVKRAMMGPAGFFAGTTQMTFHVTMSDQAGAWQVNDDVKATVRGESESKNIADSVAKNIAKRYAAERTKFEKSQIVFSPAGKAGSHTQLSAAQRR